MSNATTIAKLWRTVLAAAGAVARTIQDKLTDVGPTFEDFGAVGNGVADDSAALEAAIKHSQVTGETVRGKPRKVYRFTRTLQLVDQVTGNPARIRGAGRNKCYLRPVGTFTAIRAWGKGWGSSGQEAAFGLEFGGFTMEGANCIGTGLDLRRIGLWSEVSDLNINLFQGRGVYQEACFDHVYRDIEVRYCTGIGWHIYESKPSDPDGYRECSLLQFHNVHVIGCNANGVQWICDGGDAYSFYTCKPSEGQVGFDFINASKDHTLVGTYSDGYKDGPDHWMNVGIRVGNGCTGISITGGRFWNTKIAVEFVEGGRSSVSGIGVVFDSPVGAEVFDVVLRPGLQQIVTVAAGLAVLDQSAFGLYQPVREDSGAWLPSIAADGGIVGDFTYGPRAGRWRQVGKMRYYEGTVSWTAKPTAGEGFGVVMPHAIPVGPLAAINRVVPSQISVIDGYNRLGWFQDGGFAPKLYIYQNEDGFYPAPAASFAAAGSITFKFWIMME